MPEIVSVSDQMYSLQYSVSFAGDLFMTTTNLPYFSLENAVNNLFLDSELNHQHCLLKGILTFLTLIQEICMVYHTHLENVC